MQIDRTYPVNTNVAEIHKLMDRGAILRQVLDFSFDPKPNYLLHVNSVRQMFDNRRSCLVTGLVDRGANS